MKKMTQKIVLGISDDGLGLSIAAQGLDMEETALILLTAAQTLLEQREAHLVATFDNEEAFEAWLEDH